MIVYNDKGRNLVFIYRFRPSSYHFPAKRSSKITSCWTFPLYWFLFTPNVVIIVGTNDFFVLVAALNAAILFLNSSVFIDSICFVSISFRNLRVLRNLRSIRLFLVALSNCLINPLSWAEWAIWVEWALCSFRTDSH